jgi:hypothetical protein
MEELQVKKRGGYRANAGRKPKYSEETNVLTMRVPKSKIKDLRKVIPILIQNDSIIQILLDNESQNQVEE